MKEKLQIFKKVGFTILAFLGLANFANAQCAGGEVAVSFDVSTDTWGYEAYWEIVPTGNACGTGTVASFGNTNVGCAGGGAQAAAPSDPGAFGNNTTVTVGPVCLTIGQTYDIIMVDDWADGGTDIESIQQGLAVSATGATNVFTFTAIAPPTEDLQTLAVTGLVYTMVPVSQINPSGYPLTATVRNNGSADVTDAVLTVNVYELPNPTPIQTVSSSATGILSTASASLNAGTFMPVATGQFLLEYIVSSATITDSNLSNDTLTTAILIDSTYARDNASITGTVTGTLGIGAGTPGELGQNFTMIAQDTLTSVEVFLSNTGTPPMTGESFSVTIYNVDGTGKPTTVFGTTDVITVDAATNTMRVLPFTTPLILPVGEYAFIAQEPTAANSTIGTTTGILAPGKTWVNFPGTPAGDWANNEAFGFNVVFVLRPIFGEVPTPTGVNELTNSAFSVYPNPTTENILVNDVVKGSTLEVVNALGQVVYSEVVSNSKSNINVANYNNGLYTIRITNGNEVITNTFVKQ